MKSLSPSYTLLFSFLLVVPLLILQWINFDPGQYDFPVFLFFALWALALAFGLLVKELLTRDKSRIFTFIAFPLLLVIALIWVSIVIDQWPCFLGHFNCD